MITIGVDAHKGVHVALAVDEAGQELGQWQGVNSAAGWQAISEWAASLGGPRRWGIEGAWGYGRNLAQHLVGAGETVYEVNRRLRTLRWVRPERCVHSRCREPKSTQPTGGVSPGGDRYC